jgi:hypothetical protein
MKYSRSRYVFKISKLKTGERMVSVLDRNSSVAAFKVADYETARSLIIELGGLDAVWYVTEG